MKGLRFINYKVEKGVALVALRFKKALNLEDYDPLAAELEGVLGTEGLKGMVVNMEATEYVTSRMLGVLTATAARAKRHDIAFVACRLRPEALHVFKLTRLDAVIPIYLTEEEARKAVAR